MTPLSILLLGVLAEFTSAFPGMGNMRREAGVLPRRAAASAVSSANTAASTYPAWHPAQKGEGSNMSVS